MQIERETLIAAPVERGEATATTLAGDLPVSRVAVTKHLTVLDRAGLVESRRRGREVRYTVKPTGSPPPRGSSPRSPASGMRGWPRSSAWPRRGNRLRR